MLFGVSFLLETLGMDVGLTRMLVTLMLQCVSQHACGKLLTRQAAELAYQRE